MSITGLDERPGTAVGPDVVYLEAPQQRGDAFGLRSERIRPARVIAGDVDGSVAGTSDLACSQVEIRELLADITQAEYPARAASDGRPGTVELAGVLPAFGVVVLTFMMLMYALERRGPRFILAFAVGCALAGVYGFLAGTWPFGVVELIWAGIALRRYAEQRPEPK